MKTRVISTDIWDEDKVFTLNIDTKLLYLVLLTNPYIGQSRFYKISDRQLSTYSGLNVEQIQKCKKDLESEKIVFFKEGYVCITGYGFVECFYKGEKNEMARAKEIANIPENILNFFTQKIESLGIIEEEKRKELVIEKNRYGRKKMTNTRRERLFYILNRICAGCKTTNGLFELDHIKPLSLGGLDIDENIQVLCEKCHREKTTEDLKNLSSYRVSEISDTPINHKSEIINNKSEEKDISFETFWDAYPKKEQKKKTKAIWDSKKLSHYLSAILSFIEKAQNTDRWKKGFIKAPPVFLNGECWNDDLSSYAGFEKTQQKVLKL